MDVCPQQIEVDYSPPMRHTVRRSPQDGPEARLRPSWLPAIPSREVATAVQSVSSGLCSANPTIRKRVRRPQVSSINVDVSECSPVGRNHFAQVCVAVSNGFRPAAIGFHGRVEVVGVTVGPGDVA